MEILTLGLLTTIAIIFIASTITKTNNKDLERIEKELTLSINNQKAVLSSLNEEIESTRIDSSVNLPTQVVKVLDIYEQSNIMIPLDILEALSYNRFNSPYEIFTFIEEQRNNWKLENSKKTYRKVSK